VRHKIWDWEFKNGNWDYLEETPDPELFEYLVRAPGGGALLDLGCGNGVARCALPAGAFIRYVGVDLSAEALRRLEGRAAARPAPAGRQRLIVGDFSHPDVLAQVVAPRHKDRRPEYERVRVKIGTQTTMSRSSKGHAALKVVASHVVSTDAEACVVSRLKLRVMIRQHPSAPPPKPGIADAAQTGLKG